MFSFCQKKINVDLCGFERHSNKKPFNISAGNLVNRQFPCFFFVLSTMLRDVEKVWVVFLISSHLCVFFLQGIFIKDSNSLAYYNVTPSSVVQLQLKERGGRKK